MQHLANFLSSQTPIRLKKPFWQKEARTYLLLHETFTSTKERALIYGWKVWRKKYLEDLRVDARKNPSTTTLVTILRSGSIKGKTTGVEGKTNVSQFAWSFAARCNHRLDWRSLLPFSRLTVAIWNGCTSFVSLATAGPSGRSCSESVLVLCRLGIQYCSGCTGVRPPRGLDS